MSELRSVLAFFLGLVFFVLLIGLAIGRVKLPSKNKVAITPTIVPTVMVKKTTKPSLLDKIKNFFSIKKATVTDKKENTKTVDNTLKNLKRALTPTATVKKPTFVTSTNQAQITNITTIPETGAPSLLMPATMLLGSLGVFLRKKK